jgi:hypothetical protein
LLSFSQPIPDMGYYKPVRVNDEHIGLASIEQAEDILLYCDKKTEVIKFSIVFLLKCDFEISNI